MNKPTSLATLLGPNVNSYSDIAEKINTANSNFQVKRNDDVIEALKAQGYDQIMKPSDNELAYVNSVFQSKGFHKIENVTADVVNNIGKSEFNDLNNKLKQFTQSMGGIDTSGIYDLIDDLSKDVQESDLAGIYDKAVNAKPSLLVRLIGLFNPHYVRKSITAQYNNLQTLLKSKGGGLEVKLGKIERELATHKTKQEQNIKTLESTFDIYYNSFTELRKQFALIVYLEHSYKAQLDSFIAANQNTGDLIISKQKQDYETVYNDIQNKRAILHRALLQLPITAQQNKNLVNVCKTLMKEIDNTLVSSFPSIRSNLINIGISIMTQNAMTSTQAISELDKNSALLNSKVGGDLAVAAVTLSSQARAREADTVLKIVDNMKELEGRLQAAKEQSRLEMESTRGKLNTATEELKNLLNK